MSQDRFMLLGRGGMMNVCLFPMTDEVICIGTDPDSCAIVYPRGTKGIEPIHCQIVPQEDGGWIVVDLSEAGTWLNGIQLCSREPVSLKVGDEISLANSENRFVMINGHTTFPPTDQLTERWHEDGFKDKFFNFKGRLNRERYFWRWLAISVLFFVSDNIAGRYVDAENIELVLLMYSLPIGISGWMLLIRRMHDLNKTGWWSLLILVPFVGLYGFFLAFFKKGTDGPNRFGPDPLE